MKTEIFTLCKQKLQSKDGGDGFGRLLCRQLGEATLPLFGEEGIYVILPIFRKKANHWALAVITYEDKGAVIWYMDPLYTVSAQLRQTLVRIA